ncbi:DUF4829 domain-containing protein [Clostridium sp.]|uniref:DUF4829 domain-containing protein n=1 Tax=Clostridium sp. TaxID=1506 RepID=UPI002FC7BD81
MKQYFKVSRFIILIVICIIFIFCINKIVSSKEIDTGTSNKNPEIVVENYFKYQNDKDKEKLLTTLTKWHNGPNVVWGFENLKKINLESISEETDKAVIEGYITHGRGMDNGTTLENLKVYNVKYDVKYKDDSEGPEKSGTYEKWFYVIRENKDAPWLIDDFGY